MNDIYTNRFQRTVTTEDQLFTYGTNKPCRVPISEHHEYQTWDFLKETENPEEFHPISSTTTTKFHTGFRRRYQENIEPEYYQQKKINEQIKEQQTAEHNVKRAENLNQMKNRHGYNIITGEPLPNPNPLPDKPRAQRRHLTGEFSDEIKRETEIRLLNSKHRFHAETKDTVNSLERTNLLAQNGIPDSHKFSTIIGYGTRNLQSKGVQDNFVGNEYYKPPVGATINTLAAAGTSVTRVPSVHNNYPRDEKLFTGNATVESYLSQSQARPPTYKQSSNRTSARKNNGPLPKTLEIQSVRDLPPY